MEGRKVIVKIDAMGNTVVEADGFAGANCVEATTPIEQALAGGSGGMDRVYKPEWSQSEDAHVVEQEPQW